MSTAPFLPQLAAGGKRSLTRRDMVISASKLAGGATLALLSAQGFTRGAAAQDDAVTLTAGAAEIGASPGSAYVRSAAASAAAERGAARVEAAAALASANSEGGAIAQSQGAVAFADPDQGAVAQSVISVASAASEDDTESPAAAPQAAAPQAAAPVASSPGGGGGRAGGGAGRARGGAGRGGGGRVRAGGGGGGGRMRAGRGDGEGRRVRERAGRGGGRDGVNGLPTAGTGFLESGPLSSLLAAAAALAGIGAVALRERNAVSEPAPVTLSNVEH